ncbi:CIC11C00000002999 [Sungouiella intermedia]|uniref:V-type proton ATPase subunit a n=1 Tax=Sungouiella intermedia TaxID=45354 RepID=A0A1L0BR98_9ASCO|nr:CIC11C00000002999 [[Candida] intermedia]
MQLWGSSSNGASTNAPDTQEAIFRSAPMTLVQFYVTIELARDLVYTLGNLGQVHFRDLNAKLTPFQRAFVNELRNVDAIELKLSFLYSMMEAYATIKGDIFATLEADQQPLPSTSQIDEISDTIGEIHDRIKHLDGSYTELELKMLEHVENRHVLNIVHNFHKSSLITGAPAEDDEFRRFEIEDDDEEALLNEGRHSDSFDLEETTVNLGESNFNSICGTIARSKVPILRKILWRTLRGNLYFNDVAIDEDLPISTLRKSDFVAKNAFIIYIHGDYLQTRVKRIISSLEGSIYDNVQGNAGSRLETLNELNLKIQDLKSVVESTKTHLITELMFLQEKYPEWVYIVKRERAIYETLNKFDEDSTRRCLVGEGWIPKSDFAKTRRMLKTLVRSKMNLSSLLGASQTISLSTDTLSIPDGTSSGFNRNTNLFSVNDGTGVDDIFSDDEDDQDYNFVAVVNELSTNRTPPTYHKVNKFTSGFQSIVDTYGIATYQEVNPGLATIITFPFMFAIMFGDLGHGFIVFLVALFFIKNEKYYNGLRNKDEILDMAFSGRYIVLLMGIFSMYTGLMYNDIFSKSLTLFKSGWEWDFPENFKEGMSLTAKKINGKTYPFGLDWVWHGSENGLLFTNSYKMKMSILMGYVHMNYSLMFSLVNYRFFKSRVDIIGNFIPGFLFMQSIFGYLALTIVYKWSQDWLGTGRQPPGLLNMLINMFLAPGSIEDPLYSGQKFVQIVLVLIALACVPWLLVYKPMILRRENNRAIELGYKDINSQINHSIQLHEEEEALETFVDNNTHAPGLSPDDQVSMVSEAFSFPNDIEPMFHNSASHGSGEEEFNFMDIVIHQVIHTIEFCLNCVSHTASYLRLWALSLAHAQLSSVLWTMTLQNAFGSTGTSGIIMTVSLFAMWFTLTVCILVMMEGTSAMLHSLRLHWVEAMSKFFEGEGYAYEPFAFDKIEL